MKVFRLYFVFTNGCFKVIHLREKTEQIAIENGTRIVENLYKLKVKTVEVLNSTTIKIN